MMSRFNKALGAAGLLVGASLLGAAGLYTNGIQKIVPGSNYSHLSPEALIPIDTNLSGGRSPQTVGVEAFRVAGIMAQLVSNTATATAGAATLNRRGGAITTEALTTAPGGTYTLTLSNSAIVSGTTVLADAYSGTNTVANAINILSVAATPGQVVIVVQNAGGTALNGTLVVPFHLVN